MSQRTTGWVIFIAAVGMFCTLSAADMAKIATWHEVLSPSFVALQLAHLGVVIGAFVGGYLIPADRDPSSKDRVSDQKLSEINHG